MSEFDSKKNSLSTDRLEREEITSNEIERQEEAKLKAKYPTAAGGHSAFLLQKKLTKGQKYFDSGDYQMARQTTGQNKKPIQPSFDKGLEATGEEIPTPETVPARKTSIIQSKFHPPILATPPS